MHSKPDTAPWFFLLTMTLLMLCAGIYIHSSGRMQCILGDYERDDWFSNGIGSPTQGRDASPAASIYRSPLVPDTVRAIDNFFNATLLISCADEDYSTTSYIAYVEIRSKALSQAIDAWEEGNNRASGFRSGDLHRDHVDSSYDSTNLSGRIWDSNYALNPAPDWLPKDQIYTQSFVAFWGDGHLFKGRLPDQYFWIGYRQ